MADRHAEQQVTEPSAAERALNGATSPSVMPGLPTPDPPVKVLATAAAAGAVTALVAAFFVRRWVKKRGWA